MRLPPLRRVALAGAVVLLAGAAAACGSSTSTTTPGGDPSSSGSITVYSGQHQQTTDSLVTAFEKQTGIHVNVRYNDEDSFATEIETEGSHSPADVFYTENTPPLQELQDKGLLAPLPSSTLANTASKYNSTNGDWVGVSARVSVIIYNPSLISASQLPTTVLQLGAAKYKGKLAIAAGETDFYSVVASVDRAYGEARTIKWLAAIKSNAGGHVYADNETIADEVNRGGAAFGIVNQYYWYRMGAEIGTSHLHSKIVHFAPHDPGYVLDVSGAAVLESSKHKADADKFVAFLVSKAGQTTMANSLSYEYPLDHGVKPSAAETPFDQLQPNSITIADLGNGSTAIALMRKAGLL